MGHFTVLSRTNTTQRAFPPPPSRDYVVIYTRKSHAQNSRRIQCVGSFTCYDSTFRIIAAAAASGLLLCNGHPFASSRSSRTLRSTANYPRAAFTARRTRDARRSAPAVRIAPSFDELNKTTPHSHGARINPHITHSHEQAHSHGLWCVFVF